MMKGILLGIKQLKRNQNSVYLLCCVFFAGWLANTSTRFSPNLISNHTSVLSPLKWVYISA